MLQRVIVPIAAGAWVLSVALLGCQPHAGDECAFPGEGEACDGKQWLYCDDDGVWRRDRDCGCSGGDTGYVWCD